MIESTLCPACINDFEGEFGDEPFDYVMNHIPFRLCNEHSDRNTFMEMANARAKLYKVYDDENGLAT